MTQPTPDPAPLPTRTVTEGQSIVWRKTATGGKARIYRSTQTVTRLPGINAVDYVTGEPLTDWFPCPHRRSRTGESGPLPEPDQVLRDQPLPPDKQ